MPAIPLKDKPEGQPPSRWRITVSRSAIVILVLLGIVVLLLAREGNHYATEHPSPRVFSLAGVTFKVKDEETMVLPMSFMSEEERHKKVSKVYAFSLCAHAHLPDMNFYGDRESRKGCMDVGFKEGDWLRLAVTGTNLGIPPPLQRNGLRRRLALRLICDIGRD